MLSVFLGVNRGLKSSVLMVFLLLCARYAHSFHKASFSGTFSALKQEIRGKTTKIWSNDSKQQRLERIISNRGVGSRNDVSKLFRQGRVSIDGKVIRSGADKYSTDVTVEIDGQSIIAIPLLAVFHKPTGMHSTMKDNWGRQGLEELALEYPYMKAMHPVGRLDADTSGLLLFSSDGHLTQMLLHPSTGVEREYEAVVAGTVDMSILGPKLAAGVTTADGTFAANLLSCELLTEMARVPIFQSEGEEEEEEADDNGLIKGNLGAIVTGGEESSEVDLENTKLVPTSKVIVSVTEGKYRMVRRVLHNSGHSVLQLHRIRYGSIFLTDLEGGEVRVCNVEEKKWAETLAKTVSAERQAVVQAAKKEKRVAGDVQEAEIA